MHDSTTISNAPVSLELESAEFSVDEQGRLAVSDSRGNRYDDIRPVRLFPLSKPHQWISLIDATDKEIVCIDDLSRLNSKMKSLLEQELAKREFVPMLKRVIWVSGNSEPCEWKVETDRGITSFILKDENDVRRLGENSVLVVDSYGIRYFISDRNALDSYSCRIIEWYV